MDHKTGRHESRYHSASILQPQKDSTELDRLAALAPVELIEKVMENIFEQLVTANKEIANVADGADENVSYSITRTIVSYSHNRT